MAAAGLEGSYPSALWEAAPVDCRVRRGRVERCAGTRERRLSYCVAGARVGLLQAAASEVAPLARAWCGDDGSHLARRSAVREDGALGEQAWPVNLLGRARSRCGCVLARGGTRQVKLCRLTVKVCTGRQIRADQTVGSSPGRPGWLLLAVAVPLPLRVCGRRGGEGRGIAIDCVTGRSGPLTLWEERAQ